MNQRILWCLLPYTLLISGISLLATSAKANEVMVSDRTPTMLPQRPTQSPFSRPRPRHKTFNSSSESMNQVTSVSELQDITPTAWAYEALRGLVERYGCIVGYPDRTFRGKRSLSRWEFAAGLNACL
ncbi:iron uptake porin, partial [Crocosphaera sp.]|uniref:iron uptake porin n=1 Tax=Crocosphaera sp. TaxID=2729996 RepID=UPI002602F4BD